MPFPLGFPSSFGGSGATAGAGTVEHADAAVNRLAQYIRGKDLVEALLRGLGGRYQELEQALIDLSVYRTVDDGYGQHLDNLGAIVGQARNGLSDDEYRLYLQAKIKANLSNGTIEDILSTLTLITPGAAVLEFIDEYPAAFTIRITGSSIDSATAQALVAFMDTARAAGVRGILTWAGDSPTEIFGFDDSDLGFDDSTLAFGTSST